MEVLDIFYLEGMLEALEQISCFPPPKNFMDFWNPKACFFALGMFYGLLELQWNPHPSLLKSKFPSFNLFFFTHGAPSLEFQCKIHPRLAKSNYLGSWPFFTHGSPMARPRTFCGAPCLELHICLGLKKLKLLIVFSFLLKFTS
jgi:hypothetical protein